MRNLRLTLCIIMMAGAVVACTRPAPTTVTPTTEAPRDSSWCDQDQIVRVHEPSDTQIKLTKDDIDQAGYYIKKQLILSGVSSDIKSIVDQLGFTVIDQVDLEGNSEVIVFDQGPYANLTGDIADKIKSANNLQYQNFSIALVSYSDSFYPADEAPTTPEIEGAIRKFYDEQLANGAITVFADPNYVVGTLISGSPWGVEISPWGVEISPWGVEISQTGAPSSGTAPEDVYWSQWALHEDGVNVVDATTPPALSRTVESTGEGIDIVIFDTSPYPAGFYSFNTHQQSQQYMDLCVWKAVKTVELPPEYADDPTKAPPSGSYQGEGLDQHGLFVAGLAHAVAPNSHIHLIPVLNEHSVGTLYDLAANLEILNSLRDQPTMTHTVINLSLGFVPDIGEDLPVGVGDAFWNARQKGATVVAASGNHSTPGNILPAELPAGWPYVVGVGATKQGGGATCYSNSSEDVYAPSGNGDSSCVPNWPTCITTNGADSQCEFGVVSLVRRDSAPNGFTYAFWAGTSFSAPLVSGLSALMLEANPPPGTVGVAAVSSPALPTDQLLNQSASPNTILKIDVTTFVP